MDVGWGIEFLFFPFSRLSLDAFSSGGQAEQLEQPNSAGRPNSPQVRRQLDASICLEGAGRPLERINLSN